MVYKKIVVVGGGVLGSRIAFQSAYCGFESTILLRSEASIERAKAKIDVLKDIYLKTMEEMKTDKNAYCRGFSKEKDLTNDQIDELKARVEKAYKEIILTTDYDEACKDADLIIESIAEDPKQKTEIYQKLAKHMIEKTVIVTNSSTLLPSQFADATGRPEKYLALHFANSIWKNNSAEIMCHDRTDMKYYEEVCTFAEQINMVPLRVKKEHKGYILNSMLVPFLDAAETLWANDVADPETIDKTWVLATGAPRGPFRTLDNVGIVTAYHIKLMHPNYKNPESITRKIADKFKGMIDEGKTGVSAGEGFYKYN